MFKSVCCATVSCIPIFDSHIPFLLFDISAGRGLLHLVHLCKFSGVIIVILNNDQSVISNPKIRISVCQDYEFFCPRILGLRN